MLQALLHCLMVPDMLGKESSPCMLKSLQGSKTPLQGASGVQSVRQQA